MQINMNLGPDVGDDVSRLIKPNYRHDARMIEHYVRTLLTQEYIICRSDFLRFVTMVY
jgi:hypothetical protein